MSLFFALLWASGHFLLVCFEVLELIFKQQMAYFFNVEILCFFVRDDFFLKIQ